MKEYRDDSGKVMDHTVISTDNLMNTLEQLKPSYVFERSVLSHITQYV